MSHRVLSPQQFFHGSNKAFDVGQHVLPAEKAGTETNWPMSNPGAAYATQNMRIAGGYGRRVYRVKPLGPTEPDYYFPQHSVSSEHGFEVQEEIPSHVWQREHIPDYPER